MEDRFGIRGHLEVYRIKIGGEKEKVYDHHNTINSVLQSTLRNVLISRSVSYGVDAIAAGSVVGGGGTFIFTTFAGTTSSGTSGALIMTSVGSNQAKFSGTLNFGSTVQINAYMLGAGYTPAGAGVINMFTSVYAYDYSLYQGTTSLTFVNGESQIIDWTLQVGA